MEFEKLYFREVGTYEDVMRRPFDFDFSQRNQEALFEATNRGRNVSSTALSAVARDLLRPTADHEGIAAIDGGWGERRWAWMGIANVRTTNHCIETQYVTGYTSHDGIEVRGDNAYADRKMLLYIDSSFVIRYNYDVDHKSNQSGWRGVLSRSSQVVSASSDVDFRNNQSGTKTLTPYDVIGRRIIPDDIRDLAMEDNFHDLRSGFIGHKTKLVNRSGTMSEMYLSGLLKASQHAEASLGSEDDEITKLTTIQGALKEDGLQSDYILRKLSEDTRILDDRCVSWGELIDQDPSLDDRFKAFPVDPRDFIAMRGEALRLDGRDPSSMAALTIAQGLPTKMQQLGYIEYNFTATNDSGYLVITKAHLETLSNGMSIRDHETELDAFVDFSLFDPISVRNNLRVIMHVRCNIFSDIHIEISIDGREFHSYTFPTFSASAYSTLVTDRDQRLQELAEGVDDMLDIVRSEKRRSSGIITDLSSISSSTDLFGSSQGSSGNKKFI